MKINQATAAELANYSQHLKSLPPHDKYTRFGFSVSNETIDQLILNVLYHPEDHYIFVAQYNDTVVGFGHLAREGADWELAVSVNEDLQGQGIGNALMSHMIGWSKTHGIHSVFMHCISENQKIQHLARKHGLRTVERSGPEITAKVELPDPTMIDYVKTYLEEQQNLIKQITDLQKKLLATFSPVAVFNPQDKVE
jgi:GNAT superfamily N-acetyltransferase